MADTPGLALELPPEIDQRLERWAATTGRSKEELVISAIVGSLDDAEDEAEDLELATKRLRDIDTGKSDTLSLDEVMSRYGLDD